MKKSIVKYSAVFVLLMIIDGFSQRIGEIIPPAPPIEFPKHASGFALVFSDNGFGFGGFYTSRLGENLKGIVELTFSELKSEREIERYDYWGRPIVVGKVHRIFAVPLTLGFHWRLFKNELAENLRPYIAASIGPGVIMATDYNPDLFNSFNNPNFFPSLAASVGFGGNFGLSKTNLIGLVFRYQYIYLFDSKGVETLENVYKKEFGTIQIILRIGWMFE